MTLTRTTKILTAALAVITLGLGSIAMAQPEGDGGGRRFGRHGFGPGGFGMGRGGPGGPGFPLRQLDLTDAQREQVKAIFKQQAGPLQERMQAARSAQQELRALALSPNFDSGRARDFADTAARAQADIAVMRAESLSKVVALLTPEQRAKLEQKRERRGRR